MLHGVDRLPVAADEQTDVIALDAPVSTPSDSSTRTSTSRPKAVDDLLEQLPQHGHGPRAPRSESRSASAHRRLPERFFFLRGGRRWRTLDARRRQARVLP